ncbi:MAG: sodium-dependent transporter [Candidatus Curtissbacteria bacterium]
MSEVKVKDQRFSTSLGFLLSALAIAIGTGNIWRFPRIVAQNGGEFGAGAFIITWVLFLFMWSIPLIIGEYGIGINSRKGVVGAVINSAGRRFAWMGTFMTIVTAAITFFYSVVLGWCVYYFVYCIAEELPASSESSLAIWTNYQGSIWPLLTHAVVMVLGGIAIWKGIRSIESINKVLIPVLLLIILVALARAVTLNGSWAGIKYLFVVEWEQFGNPDIWVAALTQNAWDTGAGWGMFITYGAYMQTRFGIVRSALMTGIGNNLISLGAAVMVFGTVFAILGTKLGAAQGEILEVMRNSGPASTGLTFIWMPQLFEKVFLGKTLAILFFLGLSLAGFTSLIAQLEMIVRTFVDGGMTRPIAILFIVSISYLLGIPSAINLNILSNQDFVWGLALLISGGFFAYVVIRFNPKKLRKEVINANPNEMKINGLWDKVMSYFIPVGSITLLLWWLINDGMNNEWYDPFSQSSMMTCLMQWLIVIVLVLVLNKWVVRKTENSS